MPAMPSPPSDSSKAKPRPSSATFSSTPPLPSGAAAPRSARRRCGGRRWRAPPGRPGRRPAARRRRGRRSRLCSRARPRSRRGPDLLDLAGDRRRQAEVVERGRAQLAGQREQLAHRLVGERLGLRQLGLELRRRRLARRLQPQQQPGQRLVDLVVEVAGDAGPLLLLRLQGGRPGPPPLGFQAAHHPQEGELDPLHLLGLADAVDRARQAAARAGSGRPSPSPRSAAPAARSGACRSTAGCDRPSADRPRMATSDDDHRPSRRHRAKPRSGHWVVASDRRMGVATYGRDSRRQRQYCAAAMRP